MPVDGAAEEGGPEVVATDPEDGAASVPRRGPFVATVDRLLLPRTVNRATVTVTSGDVRAFLSVSFDPVTRRIVAIPFDDGPIEPEVTWRFMVTDVRDLDDHVADPFSVHFRTGRDEGEVHREPVATWTEVEPILARSCTGDGCHGPGPAALGLDLSSAERVRATAIGAVSRQLPAGTVGVEGGRGSLSLSGLPIVDVVAGVGRPATSYLTYKILGDPHALGEPMPPAGAPPLDTAEIALVSAWIRGGALTE